PKQYLKVKEKPIFYYCVNTFAKRKDIDAIIIVVADEWRNYVKKYMSHIDKPIYYAHSGKTRQFSIYNALLATKKAGYSDDDIVIIHDAARPLVTNDIIDQCINFINEGYDGVLPVIHVKDTIYQSNNGSSITNLLNRNELFAGQAPESFKLGKYLNIHKDISHEEIAKINGSTEIAVKTGLKIKLAEGSEINFKITTPEDLTTFKQIMEIK
ncbi:MAG TPA: IspD/TarI family cytidylyltransferase, partial [Thomasclavelia ramosa]|nr:IspD/TarI family cytidylyltransferase [Thomasclavelia ramosa]